MPLRERIAKPTAQYLSFAVAILLSLVLLSVNTQAAPVLSINSDFEEISLRPFVDVIAEQKAEPFNIRSLLEKDNQYRFTPFPSVPSTKSHSRILVRVAVENKTQRQKIMWLSFNIPGRHLVQSMAYSPDTKKAVLLNKQKNAARLVSLDANERAIYFFVLQDIAPSKLKPFVYAPEYFSQKLVKDKQWLNYGLYTFLVLPILMLFLFYATGERTFAYLALYTVSIACVAVVSANDFWQWFSVDDRVTGTIFYLVFYLAYVGNILSVREYLKRQPIGHQYNQLFTISMILTAVAYLGFIIFIGNYHPIIWLPALLAFAVPFGALCHCYFHVRDDGSGFLVVSHIVLVASLLLVLYQNLGNRDVSIFLSPQIVVIFTTEVICFYMAYYWLYRHSVIVKQQQQQQQIRSTTELFEQYRNALKQTSHNIRTPISAINNAVEELKNTPLSNSQRDALSNIYFSGQNILDQTSDLLHRTGFNYADDNTIAPFEIRYLIEECFASIQEQLIDKNIEIICDVDEEVPSAVEGNAFFIRQILITLLRHSIASTQEGIVDIRVHKSTKKEQINFVVSDTGRGLDQLTVNELMQPASSQSSAFEGLAGNHLQLTKALLDQLGAKLNVSSKLGEGSVFSFDVMLPESKLSTDVSSEGSDLLNGRTMLIVDDNQVFCRTLKQQVGNWGVKAIQTHDGTEAIALFRAKHNLDEHFDFIIIDDDLPYISGVEVAAKITAESETKPLIVLLCMPGHTPTSQNHKQAGVDLVLTKPVSQRIIRSKMIDFIEQQGSTAEPHKHEARILIAEDNDVSRRVIGKMMTVLGIDFKLVSDGQLALEACTRERFDLVLMDCEMPIMNGFKATQAIHQWQQEHNQDLTPIYALTAHVSDEHREQAFASGMLGFLEKPIQIDDVSDLVEKHNSCSDTD